MSEILKFKGEVASGVNVGFSCLSRRLTRTNSCFPDTKTQSIHFRSTSLQSSCIPIYSSLCQHCLNSSEHHPLFHFQSRIQEISLQSISQILNRSQCLLSKVNLSSLDDPLFALRMGNVTSGHNFPSQRQHKMSCKVYQVRSPSPVPQLGRERPLAKTIRWICLFFLFFSFQAKCDPVKYLAKNVK